MRRFLVLIAGLLAGPALADGAVGFQRVTMPSPAGLTVGVWYPTDAAAPQEPNTPFRQALALGAPVAGKDLPLVVISHGNGGWMGGHADLALALARAGFVVAAPNHRGDNSEDESASPAEWMVSRPADIRATIDYLATDWPAAGAVDAETVGLYGFSSGGYTALAAAGARPDLALARHHCEEDPAEFACRIGIVSGMGDAGAEADPDAFVADPRIGAVALAAPGLAFAFPAEALATVDVPVALWSGAADERVPHATNGAHVAAALPHLTRVTVVPQAGHFAFLAPCNPRLKAFNRRIWDMVCVDAEGFDRAAFHGELNAALVAFFEATLRP
ncbi:alpha/beta hydrolase family protein [Acuticoccus mangrovi]|uniref:Alpha/beta hydrolase n=1 Tax=Acuticoccus mangrovi TaxID=2796142 RepID=A0A934MG90_9HYPH|nr:alpha/beta hydrolase [Acuticoccus mangrovi]MBJ3776308.1 alpha/beta hydrolase [Acuticoccus mangrovi]